MNAETENISRESLFALVWERPSTQVARQFGISDVALAKLCDKLQVPKPPRGYWAKVRAGRRPRRPELGDFLFAREAARPHQHFTNGPPGTFVPLPALQVELMSAALEDVAALTGEPPTCKLLFNGVRNLDADTASQLLIYIPHQFEAWLGTRISSKSVSGANRSVANLIERLLPVAQEQVVVLRSAEPEIGDSEQSVVVRFAPRLLTRIAKLANYAQEEGIECSALRLTDHDVVHRPRFFGFGRSFGTGRRAEICVSRTEFWVRTLEDHGWRANWWESERHPLINLLPVLDLPGDISVPESVPEGTVAEIGPWLRSLAAEQDMCRMVEHAAYQTRCIEPESPLTTVEGLCFGEESPVLSSYRMPNKSKARHGFALVHQAHVTCNHASYDLDRSNR